VIELSQANNRLDPIAGAREVVIGVAVAVGGPMEGPGRGPEGMRRTKINAHETSDIKVDRGTIIVNGDMIRKWHEGVWGCRSDRIGIHTCMHGDDVHT